MSRQLYIAIDDLNLSAQILIDLSWDKEDGGTPARNDTRIEAAIADACNEIDGHCGIKYQVPFSYDDPPSIVQTLCQHIATYMLYSRRPVVPENIKALNDDAIKFLEKVQDNKAIIPGGTPIRSAEDDTANAGSSEQQDPVFGLYNLKGF